MSLVADRRVDQDERDAGRRGRRRGRAVAAAAVLVLVLVGALVACTPVTDGTTPAGPAGPAPGGGSGPTSPPGSGLTLRSVSTTASPGGGGVPTDAGPEPGAGATAPTGAGALAVLDGLAVVEEHPEGYDRDHFEHWITQADGCSTRERVLIDESSVPAEVDPTDCRVLVGRWTSPYDGVVVTDPRELDIDHLVPLAEAWRSGAWSWDDTAREAFANDLVHPEALVATTASANRSKGDADPTAWLPPAVSEHCAYAAEWVTVKAAWQLSVDPAEAAALRAVLTAC